MDPRVREVCVPGTARLLYDPAPGAERRLVAALLGELPQLKDGAALGVVTDSHVGPLHGARFLQALSAAGVRAVPVTVPAGEHHKTLAEVESVARALIQGGVDRGGALLALGGGVLSDMAGLAAALLLRGVPWVVSPTTLLSQADAAIGGKTAVNLPEGKNLLGAFHAPRLMYADLTTLQTLPGADLRAGLGEILKHALLTDGALMGLLHRHAEAMADGAAEPLADALLLSGRYKSQLVAHDPHERADAGRVLLNLGHTVGHALEAASLHEPDFPCGPLRHGEAVGLGLLAAARVGQRLLGPEAALYDLIHGLLLRLGLPTELDARLWVAGALRPGVAAALGVDKKRAGRVLRYVVAVRSGDGFVGQVVPLALSRLVELLPPPGATI